MITVKANARSASYDSDDLITSGSAGIPCEFVLSSDFNGLSSIAVFEGSGTARDVALIGNSCVVPHEVLTTAGGYLRIGIYAANSEGTIVIPTVWAGSKMILQGTEPSEVDPSAPTPSWVAQVQAAAAEAVQTSEEAIEIAGGAQAAADDARESASAAAASATAAGQSASAAGTAQAAAEAASGAAASARDAAVAAQGSAESSAQAAAGSATAAAGSAAAAAASEAAAREVEESIPADYTALSEDVSELKSQITNQTAVNEAIVTVLQHVAYADDDGAVAYQALHDLIYPPTTIVSISAVYTPGIVYTWDSVNSLKSSLVVKAIYSDSSEETIDAEDYTLSGSLAIGNNTITVAYSGLTTTFTVSAYGFEFTKGYTMGTDSGTNYSRVKDNSARIIAASSYGVTPFKDNDGYTTLYPVPIRQSISKIVTSLPSGYGRAYLILSYDSVSGEYSQAQSSGWQTSMTEREINQDYRTGAYYCALNIRGQTGTEDTSDMDTSNWSITLT